MTSACDGCHHSHPCMCDHLAERALRLAPRCAEWIEKRGKGKRYVYSRTQCKNTTRHESGYCHQHRSTWRVPK